MHHEGLVEAPVPDLASHHEQFTDLDAVWDWINPAMLYGRHMGLKDAKAKIELYPRALCALCG